MNPEKKYMLEHFRKTGSSEATGSAVNSGLTPSPCQSASHSRRDRLAQKTGGPETAVRTRCTRGAAGDGVRAGKSALKQTDKRKNAGPAFDVLNLTVNTESINA